MTLFTKVAGYHRHRIAEFQNIISFYFNDMELELDIISIAKVLNVRRLLFSYLHC